MNPIQLLLGDVLEQLCHLPSDSVHCVVTSPPYWQVRDYGVTGQLGRDPADIEHQRRTLGPIAEAWLRVRRAGAQHGAHCNGAPT